MERIARLDDMRARKWLIAASLFAMVFVYKASEPLFNALMFALLMPVITYATLRNLRRGEALGTAIFRVMLFAAAWTVMTTILHRRADLEWVVRFWFIGFCWFYLLFVPRDTPRAELKKQLGYAGAVVVAGCLPLFLIALASVFTGRVMRVPFFNRPVGIQSAGSIGDPFIIFAQRNVEGRFASYCILFALYGMLSTKKAWLRAFLGFDLLVSFMTLAHCQSRAAYIGVSVALGLVAFRAVFLHLPRRGRRVAAGALATALAFFAVMGGLKLLFKADIAIARGLGADRVTVQAGEIVSRVESAGEFAMFSNGRADIWLSSLDYLKRHPRILLTGTGGTTDRAFRLVKKAYPAMREFVGFHNSYLNALFLGGIPLLAAMLAFLCGMVPPCLRVFLRREGAENRGLFVVPVFILMQLIMAVPENVLLAIANYANLIFFLLCGAVLHDDRLDRQS